MLTITLEPHGAQPLYEQLYRGIRHKIEQGALAAGERLPSKRALAAHLKVSVVTVEGAYGQLLAEGYLRSEPKRGFFVQPFEAQSAPAAIPARPSAAASVKEKSIPYDFTTNAVDTARFPFSTWARLMREVLTQEDSGLLAASHPQGVEELRQAIVRYLGDFRGIQAEPEQIVVGAGSEYLTGLLTQLLGREGGYAVEDPGYRKPARILSNNGAQVLPIPLDAQGLRVDLLERSRARVAHVTPSHHFPLGMVMPVTRRRALLSWAGQSEDRYIIEDDYDSEFRFSGRPIPALQSLDTGERVVYLNTFAKSLAPSLRISYMVLPPHLLARYRQELQFYSSTVPSFEQYALARFMERGHFERHIARMRTLYKGIRDSLLSAAREEGITSHGTFSGAEAGLHLLLQMNNGMTEPELVRRAAEAGVGVYPLSSYYLAPGARSALPTLVMGYARMRGEDMAPAFSLLRKAWALDRP